jgi:hypothetical protein
MATTTATAAATPEKRVRKNAYAKVESKLWAIHGQYYDLASFVDSHPGGSEMLLLGRGRDCTEMFESVHALSKRNVHALLAKYRVDAPAGAAPAPTEMFAWKSDGFYSVLAQRVRKHFEETDPAHYNYKATSTYWFKVTAFFVTWLALIYHAFTAGSLLAGLMAGFVMNILGFCVMHDGSHYGTKPPISFSSPAFYYFNLYFIYHNSCFYCFVIITAFFRHSDPFIPISPEFGI